MRANLAVMPERHKVAACLKMRIIPVSQVKCVKRSNIDKYQGSEGSYCCKWAIKHMSSENRSLQKDSTSTTLKRDIKCDT